MTEVISRKELIDYWMDPQNNQLCLIGGIGSGKTTLCQMFKDANPDAFVYDVDSYDSVLSVIGDFITKTPDVFRVAEGISPVMLWIPGVEYLLLSADSNPYIPDDVKEIFRQGVSPDHHICNHVPKFKYQA